MKLKKNAINFEKKVLIKIKKLQSPKELYFFAWLCAIRSLPFLSINHNFSYWGKKDIGNNLQTIFYALDTAIFSALATTLTSDAARDILVSNDVSAAAVNALSVADRTVTIAAKATISAVAYANIPQADAAFTSASTAADFVSKSAATTGYIYYNKKSLTQKLQEIIFNDIEMILGGQFNKFHSNIDIYGKMWNNFQKYLIAIGGKYWADVYAELFTNRFQFDDKALKSLVQRISVPIEVRQSGAVAVAEYLDSAEKQGTIYTQRETRLIILGSAGAGKTTLARRLNDDMSYPEPDDTTHGVNTEIELNFNGIKTHIWDFGGQVIYHASHRCFMSENCVYILVINARTEDNRDIGRIEYWLDTIRVYSNDRAKVYIVINESDNRKQDIENYRSFMEGKYKSLILGITNFNIGKDRENIDFFRDALKDYIEKTGHQVFGKYDSAAMLELKNLFDENKTVLGSDDFVKILNKNHIVEKRDQIRAKELFNDLGIALSYDFMDGYILDPYWISHGVYKIIDYMQKNDLKIIRYGELSEVFADERNTYPSEKNECILDLMAYYKIGFRNEGGTRGLIVPCVASQFRPREMTVDVNPDCLLTKIEREGLKEFPADFFYKFICANNDAIKKNDGRWSMWQTGMVLAENGASALVELIENRRLEITVWGEMKKLYNIKLEKFINELLQEYHFTPYEHKRKNREGKSEKFISLAMESFGKGSAKAVMEVGTDSIFKWLIDVMLKIFPHSQKF